MSYKQKHSRFCFPNLFGYWASTSGLNDMSLVYENHGKTWTNSNTAFMNIYILINSCESTNRAVELKIIIATQILWWHCFHIFQSQYYICTNGSEADDKSDDHTQTRVSTNTHSKSNDDDDDKKMTNYKNGFFHFSNHRKKNKIIIETCISISLHLCNQIVYVQLSENAQIHAQHYDSHIAVRWFVSFIISKRSWNKIEKHNSCHF